MHTPFTDGYNVLKSDCPPEGEQIKHPYRSIIGIITYAAYVSRPDIMYHASKLGQVSQNPGLTHWNMAKRVLKYLYQTRDRGPFYKRNGPDLEMYSDSSYADIKPETLDPSSDELRSTIAHVAMLSGGAITWSSKVMKGKRALSSGEAETAAASEACRTILFLRGLLEFMTNKFEGPTPLKIDATVAITIANREGLTNKSRHMQIKHLFIQECVIDNDMRVHKSNRGNVVTQKVDTTAQLADPLTKPLGKILHKQYLDILAPKLITRA